MFTGVGKNLQEVSSPRKQRAKIYKKCHSSAGGNPGKGLMSVYWVYILASKGNGTLYTGVTGDLLGRIYTHKEKLVDGLTKKYNVNQLVYAEGFGDIHEAIAREKCIKKWNRAWKIRLIEAYNPEWRDLYEDYL